VDGFEVEVVDEIVVDDDDGDVVDVLEDAVVDAVVDVVDAVVDVVDAVVEVAVVVGEAASGVDTLVLGVVGGVVVTTGAGFSVACRMGFGAECVKSRGGLIGAVGVDVFNPGPIGLGGFDCEEDDADDEDSEDLSSDDLDRLISDGSSANIGSFRSLLITFFLSWFGFLPFTFPSWK